MVKVKICGVQDPDMAAYAMECGADWVGVVLVGASPRCVSADMRRTLAREIGPLRSVALVIQPRAEDAGTLAHEGFGVIQLHGNETPGEAAALKSATGERPVEVWKAVGIGAPGDLAEARRFWTADRLLLDARPPEGATRTGGHGAVFDWSLLADWTPARPWLLAGGLTPDNVAEAIARTGADAVDVSSGVESAPGVKDKVRIRDFIAAAKGL